MNIVYPNGKVYLQGTKKNINCLIILFPHYDFGLSIERCISEKIKIKMTFQDFSWPSVNAWWWNNFIFWIPYTCTYIEKKNYKHWLANKENIMYFLKKDKFCFFHTTARNCENTQTLTACKNQTLWDTDKIFRILT